MRIPSLLQKISDIAESNTPRTIIDIDLMLDYTRVLYADLLEWRGHLAPAPFFRPSPGENEPTLDELTQAMYDREETEAATKQSFGRPLEETRLSADTGTAQIPADFLQSPIPQHPTTSPASRNATAGEATISNNIQQQAPASKDIRSMISINDKYQFMSELFGNDKAAYETALDTINLSDSEESAVKWLQERLWVAEEQRDTAQSFYHLVRQFKG